MDPISYSAKRMSKVRTPLVTDLPNPNSYLSCSLDHVLSVDVGCEVHNYMTLSLSLGTYVCQTEHVW
jgi:hypothetical protein